MRSLGRFIIIVFIMQQVLYLKDFALDVSLAVGEHQVNRETADPKSNNHKCKK